MNDYIQTQLMITIEKGELKEYRKLFQTLNMEKQREFVKYNSYQYLHLAMAQGQLDIFNEMASFIFANIDNDMEALVPAFVARNGEGFRQALDSHQWPLIEELMNDEFLQYYCFNVIVENENYIASILNQPSLKHFVPDLFNLSCKQSVLSVQRVLNIVPFENLEHLFKIQQRDLSNLSSQWGPFENAAYVNQIDVIEFLWNFIPDSLKMNVVKFYFPECMLIATKNGYVGVIDTILSFLTQKQQWQVLKFQDYNVFVYAADRGDVEIMKLVWETLPNDQRLEALTASNFAAYRLAYQNTHIAVLNFLESVASNELLDKMKKTERGQGDT